MEERIDVRRESPEKISFQGEVLVVWIKVLGVVRFTRNCEGRADGTY